MSLRGRIDKLERGHGGNDGCGPGCPPSCRRIFRRNGPEGEPVLRSQVGDEEPCQWCGRPAEVHSITEVIVRTPADVERSRAKFGQDLEEPGEEG